MNKIRVGLLVDDMAAPAWVTHMLGQIAAEQGMEIALIVKYAYRAQPAGKAAAPRDPWLLSLWMEVDRRLVSVPDDAFSSEPLSLALPALQLLLSPLWFKGLAKIIDMTEQFQ